MIASRTRVSSLGTLKSRGIKSRKIHPGLPLLPIPYFHKSIVHHGPLQRSWFPPYRYDVYYAPHRQMLISPPPSFRAGANREVKKAVEAYWAGKISADDLTKAAADVKKASWTGVKAAKVDLIPRFASPSSDLMTAVNLSIFLAVNSPCMITFLITLLLSMLFRNATWGTTSPLSISTSRWAVVAKAEMLMFLLVR